MYLLVLNTLLDRKPMMIAKQTSNVVQALNVTVGKTSEYDVTVVKPTVYQGGDQSGQCVCRTKPLMDLICLRAVKHDDNTWLMWVFIVIAPLTFMLYSLNL